MKLLICLYSEQQNQLSISEKKHGVTLDEMQEQAGFLCLWVERIPLLGLHKQPLRSEVSL